MKRLIQRYTVAEHGRGDCLRTAFACVLGLDEPEQVPDFIANNDGSDNDNWWFELHDWFKERGFWLDTLSLQPVRDGTVTDPEVLALLDGLHVVSGISPRTYLDGSVMHHAVVACGRQSTIVHDPHPAQTGIAGLPNYAYTLKPL